MVTSVNRVSSLTGYRDLYRPTYDSGDGWTGSLQHIAREGCCWVVGCGNLMQGSDFPDDFPEKSTLYPDANEWVNRGDSVVIAPGGEIIAGHYSRPDIFTLHVNTKAQAPVVFEDQANA